MNLITAETLEYVTKTSDRLFKIINLKWNIVLMSEFVRLTGLTIEMRRAIDSLLNFLSKFVQLVPDASCSLQKVFF